jgi:hypothetical protein
MDDVTPGRRVRTPEEYDRFRMALVPVDQAFFASETKWGVGRLERIVSLSTLEAWRRGWELYRAALEDTDGEALATIGPKMVAALGVMDAEATAAGHAPLAPDTWEAAMGNGVTLVVCRTSAEASAVMRAASAAEKPGQRSFETTIPPDLAITVRDQHEGRALVVITLAEIVRLLQAQETDLWGTKWQGTPADGGRVMEEMAAHDLVRNGYPLPVPIGADVSRPVPAPQPVLPF